jgi:hypothetical protein
MTILKKVYFRKAGEERFLPGYFIKWTKMGLAQRSDSSTIINTEIEVAIIADADTGETFMIKTGDFKIDINDFIKANKISPTFN